jgi:ComF family protein
MLRGAIEATIRLLLEPECVVCAARLDRPLAGPVCSSCWSQVSRLTPPWCAVCGDAVPIDEPEACCSRCREARPVFDVARSAGLYERAFREIVHAFKYRGCRVLAEPLGRLMRESGADLLEGADAVVPVPLHPWRQLARGFNQADDLARQLRLPVWRLLRRRRYGPPQAALTAVSRRRNAAGSYEMGWLAPRSRVRGCVLVLVDDVMTTGSTLDACSRALLDAGARSVRALTAGRAVAGRPGPPTRRPRLSDDRRR